MSYQKRKINLSKELKSGEVTKTRQIKIQWYFFPDHRPLAITLLKPVSSVAAKRPQLIVPKIDYLWYSVAIFQNIREYGPRPNWSGFRNCPTEVLIIHCPHKSQCFHLSTMRAAYSQLYCMS